MRIVPKIVTIPLIVLVISAGIINSEIGDELFSYFAYSDKSDIESVESEVRNKTIQFNVRLKKTMSCSEASKILNADKVKIGERMFIPSCKKITNKELRITYHETVSA
jgi:hypothetical protein